MAKQNFTNPTADEPEKAVLVGLATQQQSVKQLQEYLDELAFLAETAGAVTVKTFYQKLTHPDKATYVGSGKLIEISEYVAEKGIDLVIFDDEISPSQLRNIEKEVKVKVLDRSMLILDIFAKRAQTLQAKIQVDLAQTQYLLPRLRGMWQHLDRVKGGIGMRGSGEKEIETDRRVAQQKISRLKAQLQEIDKQNFVRRKGRDTIVRVALVGYTNVGKSTIMKLLSKEDVFAENKLFATLDTTVRKIVFDNVPFLLSDTVGFIRKLPHHLVESFKSTLDETLEADLLLHVVDISHPSFEEQMQTVQSTLQELKAADRPTIIVFNKMDKYEKEQLDEYLEPGVRKEVIEELKQGWISRLGENVIFISALEKQNIDAFKNLITEKVKEIYKQRFPHQERLPD